ncbi:Protein argonaute-2 [Trichinella pseudospiralis]
MSEQSISIHTTHRNQDRVYRIKDISGTAASVVFEKDGKKVSIAEYFHDVYAPLKYPNLPLVQVGSKSKAIYFPVEEKFSFKTVRENKPSEVTILIKPTGLVHLDFKNAEAGLLDEREKGAVQFLDILFAQGRSCPLFENSGLVEKFSDEDSSSSSSSSKAESVKAELVKIIALHKR